jgi:L-rhamnose mutarotase
MQRVCFVLQVKPGRLDEYKERHRLVWPEMQAALRETGWGNYSLFLRDDGLLVGYLETEDFERARAAMGGRDVNSRWQREMGDFFVQADGASPDKAMRPLEEIFHL